MTARVPFAARIVTFSCDRAWTVVALGTALVITAFVYAMQHFAIIADSLELISPDLPWRQNKATFDNAFPQLSDLIVIVVDGATPELAENGATVLAARLQSEAELFRSVRRPDGGSFFDRNGLLFLPLSEVVATTNQLIAAQPFLGPLVADPSLRGVMSSLSTALMGVEEGETKLEKLGPPIRAFADALQSVVEGKTEFFSWQKLVSGDATARETRRLILVEPVLNLDELTPGARASGAIRRFAHEAQLYPENGVSVRLTGSVVLADDEFSTLTEHAAAMTSATIVAVLLMLWLAVRSVRIVACIMVTTIVGLVLTTALGLLLVGRFNLISVAFIPVFVGLGVDFAIQFSVRYQSERLAYSEIKNALTATGAVTAGSLALAAAAIAAGFLAFFPTAYLGASELGMIAGPGMAIAFLLSITLLPALLLVLAGPSGRHAGTGIAALVFLDRHLMQQRKVVLATAGIVAAISLASLPLLRFDFNPIHLKNSHLESVSTLMDLMSDPERTPNTIDVLAGSLTTADALAERLSHLPEVDGTVTLSSFVPQQQTEKLTQISDAAALLDLTLDPPEVNAPPTDGEVMRSLAATADALRRSASSSTEPASNDAMRLAMILDQLAAAPAAKLRTRAGETLIAPLQVILGRIRAMLQAKAITLQNLPQDLVQDWVSKDGRARIQIFPKGDSNDNQTLRRFSNSVQTVAPNATGTPISIQEAARMIEHAFLQAGIYSFFAIAALLTLVLRRVRDVILTLIPIVLTGLLTLASCALIGQPLNFANIIALPLLFGVGVAFNIYFVGAWRSGATHLLESSLARAVVFSALTTGTAFGSLCVSSHPGTASMGELLMISLAWTLLVVLLFQPALLATPLSGRRSSDLEHDASATSLRD